MSTERSHGRRGAERSAARSNGHSRAGARVKAGGDKASRSGGRRLGQLKQVQRQKTSEPHGRGQANPLGRGQAKAPSGDAPSSRAPAERGTPAPSASKPLPAPAPATAPKPTPPGQLKQSK